jgi:hypothetical protein
MCCGFPPRRVASPAAGVNAELENEIIASLRWRSTATTSG